MLCASMRMDLRLALSMDVLSCHLADERMSSHGTFHSFGQPLHLLAQEVTELLVCAP